MNHQHAACLATLLALALTTAYAAPPAQGPAEALAGSSEELLVVFLRYALQEAVEETIEASEGDLRWADGAKPLECGYDCVSPPRMMATGDAHAPNQRYAAIPATISLVAKGEKLGVTVHRTIHTNIEFRIYCDGWRGGEGNLTICTWIGRPWVDEDHSLFEDIIDFFVVGQLTSSIDSAFARRLNFVNLTVGDSPCQVESGDSSCRSLGVVSNYATGRWQWDLVLWEPVDNRPMVNVGAGEATVTFTDIVRLSPPFPSIADDFKLEAFVNGTWIQFPSVGQLELAPGESRALEGELVRVPAIKEDDTLQIIVNDGIGGTEWDNFDVNTQFGDGTHTIRPMRMVSVGLINGKPQKSALLSLK